MDEYLRLEYEEFDRLTDMSKTELFVSDFKLLLNIHCEENMHRYKH